MVSKHLLHVKVHPLKTAANKIAESIAAPNGARMTGENRRLQIVRVAMRLFSQKGFRGTTTKEIAQAAGVWSCGV